MRRNIENIGHCRTLKDMGKHDFVLWKHCLFDERVYEGVSLD